MRRLHAYVWMYMFHIIVGTIEGYPIPSFIHPYTGDNSFSVSFTLVENRCMFSLILLIIRLVVDLTTFVYQCVYSKPITMKIPSTLVSKIPFHEWDNVFLCPQHNHYDLYTCFHAF